MPQLSQESKLDLVDKLLVAKQKGHRAEMTLRFQGETDSADDAKAANNRLSRKIDRLLGELMDEWSGNARRLQERVSGINARLQAAVRDLRAKKKVVENAVKLVGLLDDATDVAKSVLG